MNDDLISRKALRKCFAEQCPGDCSSCDSCSATNGKLFCGLIDDAPAVDAVPVRHGKWKSMGDCGVTECSICKWSIEEYVGDYNYCPICGARMDEGVSGDGKAQD